MMNGKIRELVEQSGFFPVPDETEGDWEFRAENARYERFAELIIKECCRIVNLWTDEDLPEGREDVVQTIWIKKTFGIE